MIRTPEPLQLPQPERIDAARGAQIIGDLPGADLKHYPELAGAQRLDLRLVENLEPGPRAGFTQLRGAASHRRQKLNLRLTARARLRAGDIAVDRAGFDAAMARQKAAARAAWKGSGDSKARGCL